MKSGELSIESPRQRVTWKVPGFFELRYDTESPEFYSAGYCYHLRLHRSMRLTKIKEFLVCVALEGVRRVQAMRTPTISCELERVRLKSRTGNEIELKRSSQTFFIDRRELKENSNLYDPDGTLTFICYIVGEHISAGGPHSEEQQEGFPGVAKLQSDYRQLLKKGAERDASLVVSGKEFRAHKDILRARSPVFEAMFDHETAEKKSGRVVIDDLDSENFGEFLEYLYTGGVEAGISDDNVFGLYSAADKYDVPTLKSECGAHMRRNLSVECFCDVMTVALRHNDEDLQQKAARFLKENIARIVVTPKWKQIVKDNGTIANELLIKAFVPGEQ